MPSLVLSMPHGLNTLPSFDDLGMLATLIIGDVTHLTHLPSLHKLNSLRYFSLFRRNAMCCNGFLTGTDDLADFQCLPRADEELVTCETARPPQADRARLDRIHAFVCSMNVASDVVDSEPTVASTDGACIGVVFKQCGLGGRDGICFNERRQIVHGDDFGEYEVMRRLEIARGVGSTCDPSVEHWLGYTNQTTGM